jgi:hypothetical protein
VPRCCRCCPSAPSAAAAGPPRCRRAPGAPAAPAAGHRQPHLPCRLPRGIARATRPPALERRIATPVHPRAKCLPSRSPSAMACWCVRSRGDAPICVLRAGCHRRGGGGSAPPGAAAAAARARRTRTSTSCCARPMREAAAPMQMVGGLEDGAPTSRTSPRTCPSRPTCSKATTTHRSSA